MLGIAIGFVAMIVGVGVGLMRLFDAWPAAYAVLRVGSLAYLAWLRSGSYGWLRSQGVAEAGARPMTIFEAASFQWVNPKAWAMALAAITLYAPSRGLAAILLVALVFGAINLPSVSTWAAAGRGLRRFLDRPARLRTFNWTMAALLLASTIPML